MGSVTPAMVIGGICLLLAVLAGVALAVGVMIGRRRRTPHV